MPMEFYMQCVGQWAPFGHLPAVGLPAGASFAERICVRPPALGDLFANSFNT